MTNGVSLFIFPTYKGRAAVSERYSEGPIAFLSLFKIGYMFRDLGQSPDLTATKLQLPNLAIRYSNLKNLILQS